MLDMEHRIQARVLEGERQKILPKFEKMDLSPRSPAHIRPSAGGWRDCGCHGAAIDDLPYDAESSMDFDLGCRRAGREARARLHRHGRGSYRRLRPSGCGLGT